MSKPTYYYLDPWIDETVPCEPSLQGWADWLCEPDEDWDRPEAAKDGDEFDAANLTLLGDVRAEWSEQGFAAVEPVPEGTMVFYLRHHEGCCGWDAAYSAETIRAAAQGLTEDDGPLWFACMQDGPRVRVRFNATDEGPRLTILGAVQ